MRNHSFCCIIQMVRSEFDFKNISKDPSCLGLVFQAAGVVMWWGIFSWFTLGSLIPNEHCLNTVAYLCISADDVHILMTSVSTF